MKKFKRAVMVSFATCFISCSLVYGQGPTVKKCELQLKDSPSIRGLKLGMTSAELNPLFSGVFRYPYKLDSRATLLMDSDRCKIGFLANGTELYSCISDSHPWPAIRGFEGIDTIGLGLFDGVLHMIKVEYSKSTAILSKDQLKAKIIESFQLPSEGWVANQLLCQDFFVSVGDNELSLLNQITQKKIKEREELKLKTFKP